MNNIRQEIREAADWLAARGIERAAAGIVLGTGMGSLIENIEIRSSIPYTEIPYFPLSTMEFQQGRLMAGRLNHVEVLVMQGRFHYYEGYSLQQVTFPLRVMHALGIKHLLLSNAAGGMNPGFKKGDLVIIEDHINLIPDNPLRGISDPELGNRFADMSCPYDRELNRLLAESFSRHQLPVKQGIYVAVAGPSLETRAEYRWLRSTGADMVGMSTVPEVIVAAQLGLPCAAVSVITDECDPDNLHPVNIPEIIGIAGKADRILSKIFTDIIGRLAPRDG